MFLFACRHIVYVNITTQMSKWMGSVLFFCVFCCILIVITVLVVKEASCCRTLIKISGCTCACEAYQGDGLWSVESIDCIQAPLVAVLGVDRQAYWALISGWVLVTFCLQTNWVAVVILNITHSSKLTFPVSASSTHPTPAAFNHTCKKVKYWSLLTFLYYIIDTNPYLS